MKLELKHILSYPKDLKVQYTGIVNTKQLKEWRKKEPKGSDFFSEEYSQWDKLQPEEIVGEKISTIKGIKFFKNYHVIRVGRSFGYGKNESTSTIKPILRSLTDLAKEIEHNGERFVPASKLFNLHEILIRDGYTLNIDRFYYHQDGYSDFEIKQSFDFWQKLLEWKFDIFKLIDSRLAIDVSTLNENPYK